MIFRETAVSGVFLVVPEPVSDERGFFAGIFDAEEFAGRGIATEYPFHAVSFNDSSGTLRGLHNQRPPHAEAKLVRCTRGRVFDVTADIRGDSPTYRSVVTTELSADNRHTVAIPPGCVHGFLTLEDGCEITYHLSQPLVPAAVAGVRWDDPGLGIPWPAVPRVMSDRDRTFPDFDW